MEDRLRRLSPRDTLIISLCLAGFYYFFMFDAPSLQTQTRNKENQIQQIQAEIAALSETISRRPLIEGELEQVKNEISQRAARFRMNMAPERVQQIISEEARAAGIFFESITDSKVSVMGQSSRPGITNEAASKAPAWFSIEKYIDRFEISTSFSGTYAQVMRFLSYLTRTDDVITLTKVNITSGSLNSSQMLSGKSPSLKFDVTFEAYSLLQNVTEGALKPPSVDQGGD